MNTSHGTSMKIKAVTIEVIERVIIISKPGEPDLVKLIDSGWLLDWRDGGLHGDPSTTPRRYCFRRNREVKDDEAIAKLIAEIDFEVRRLIIPHK